MHDFLSSNEMSNIISILALLAALYSIWYTKRFNRPRISIEDFHVDRSYEYPSIEFSILNFSNTPITLKSITFSFDGHPVYQMNDYEGPKESMKLPNGMRFQNRIFNATPLTLENETTMLPNSKDRYRYYFKNVNHEVTITVKTNRMLSICSKKKSFVFRTNE
jgi:hypothetical protein